MILRCNKKDGTQTDFELGERPVTIGRSPDADMTIADDKASRLHCGIRLWDGDFYIKDLKSKNGTFVNGQPVDMVKLNPGDRIRIGATVFTFEQDPSKGTQTVLREVEDEMSRGKGYTTILREIIQDAPSAAASASPAGQPIPPPVVAHRITDEIPVMPSEDSGGTGALLPPEAPKTGTGKIPPILRPVGGRKVLRVKLKKPGETNDAPG